MSRRALLGAPRQGDEERAAAQPVHEVAEEAERCLVGPVDVVDDDDAGALPADAVGDESADRLVEACLGREAVEGRRRRGAELGQQSCGLETPPGSRRIVGVRRLQGGAHQLHHDAEREPGLLLEAPHGRCPGVTIVGDRRELVAQPGLADPGLADDREGLAIGLDRLERAPQDLDLVVAAHERVARVGAAFGLAARLDRRGRRVGTLEDRVVERRRLVEWPDAELAVEHPHAFAVLLERARAVAGVGEEPDQLPVRGLVERIEGEPAPRSRDRAGVISTCSEQCSQPVERHRDLAPELLGRQLLPVVELGAVAEPEALEERPAVERDRRSEGTEAAGQVSPSPCPWVAQEAICPRSSAMSSQTPSRSSATVSRSTASQRPPSAVRSVESVRLSAERARSGSASGQKSPVSTSRRTGRSVTARYARSAVAFLVSTASGVPSIATRGAPSNAILSPPLPATEPILSATGDGRSSVS